MSSKLLNSDKLVFITLIVLAAIINLSIVAFMDLESSRLARLMTILLFLIYFLVEKKIVNFWTLSALLFFTIRDVFFQFYEEPLGYKLYLIIGILCYVTLVLERMPKISEINIKPSVIVVTLLLVAANTYTLYVIMNMSMVTHTFHDNLEPLLLYAYGAAMMVLGVQAIAYNNKYNSNRSLLYIFFAFGFIFSDIAALFAYYFNFEMFYFLDRFFFLGSLAMLVNYGLNFESVKEEYYQFEMIDKKL
ncbi:hypothetical protein [Leeuwenhoekiella marinoflava]|uniref:YhhN-like protein n=2 Tax=Leeuwenhoekiella marinoflava TaxID=988 RepID=A0A4V1KS51_9FLAO|nr:hypothetical protein [Leeuwenhoekiella marinoflava]RXG27600.1 hypothetical protein DSL99_2824 [Leeuwenhoekiella marinoflava]SHF66742.1 hypothetical protein SAMN02745246_03117 [Leeuwenhoekiella marinoflava DSM 3653]